MAYDELYRVKTVTDILGHQSQHFAGGLSDEMWKQGQMISPLNEVTTTVYDYRNNLLQTTDPLGRITTNQYDILDRKIQTTHPEGDYDVFAYDLRSNLLSTTKYPKPSVTPVLPALTSSSVYMEGAGVLTCVNLVICNKPQSETDARGNVDPSKNPRL